MPPICPLPKSILTTMAGLANSSHPTAVGYHIFLKPGISELLPSIASKMSAFSIIGFYPEFQPVLAVAPLSTVQSS